MKKLLTAVLLAATAASASAAPLFTNTGFSANATTVGFSGLTAGTMISNQFAAQGLTIAGPLSIGSGYQTAPNISGGYFDSFTANQTRSSSSIYDFIFAGPVSRAGAFFEFNGNTTAKLTALLGGNVVESFTITNNDCCQTATFYGFAGITFDTMRLSNVSGTDFYGDSVTFDAVPEPAMLGLFGLGAVALGIRRRRTR